MQESLLTEADLGESNFYEVDMRESNLTECEFSAHHLLFIPTCVIQTCPEPTLSQR